MQRQAFLAYSQTKLYFYVAILLFIHKTFSIYWFMYLFIYIVNITLGARGLFTQLFIYKIIYEFILTLFTYFIYLFYINL